MNCTPLFARVRIASAPRRDLRLCARAIPCSALLHIKFHAIEFGHVEVDELAGDTAVVCPKRLARCHMGDNLALDDAFLIAFGGRGLDGDGVILKALLASGDFSR